MDAADQYRRTGMRRATSTVTQPTAADGMSERGDQSRADAKAFARTTHRPASKEALKRARDMEQEANVRYAVTMDRRQQVIMSILPDLTYQIFHL